MIAASYWSLLAPAIEYAERSGYQMPWIPATVGFLAGGVFLYAVDKMIPESQRNGFSDFATLGVMAGFSIMMTLDVALG